MLQYRTSLKGLREAQLTGFFVGWRKPLTKGQHYQILKNSECKVIAFDTESRRVVGFVNALSDGVNFAYISMLEVLPEYQKSGIGKQLMRRMLTALDKITCVDLTCYPGLQKYYEQFGMLRSNGMVLRKYLTPKEVSKYRGSR